MTMKFVSSPIDFEEKNEFSLRVRESKKKRKNEARARGGSETCIPKKNLELFVFGFFFDDKRYNMLR